MQFKTSCCNKTLLKKHLTRFAPLWGVYTLGLLMLLFLTWDDKSVPFYNIYAFRSLFSGMALYNGVYALAVVAMLFGDLYNTRMCYGTHALPMTRGCWFGTHILSGLLFSLIPTALMAAASIPLLNAVDLEQGWQLGFYLFVDMNLQYLTFFGIGVFAAMCAGNRFGQTAIYGMLMVGSILLYLPADALLAPLLFGVPSIIYVFGVNKIVDTLDEAIDRVRNHACPLNARRLNKNTPCAITGKCSMCNSADCICNVTTIVHHPTRLQAQVHLIIVPEQLGY